MENIQAEIARLRAENEALKAKVNVSVPELPILEEYDPKVFASMEDLAPKLGFPNIPKLNKAEVSALLKVHKIEPQAQHRPASQAKGRGTHLFLLAEVVEMLKHIQTFRAFQG